MWIWLWDHGYFVWNIPAYIVIQYWNLPLKKGYLFGWRRTPRGREKNQSFSWR